MAKKKSKPIETEVTEDAIIVEAYEPKEDLVEIAGVVIDEPIEEEVIEVAEPKDESNQFIYAQLKAINKLSNPAKAKRLAERVLRNRKR